MNKIKDFLKNKKFKYGATAIAFTCVCIALVIIFNVIFSSLADKFLWSVDMTSSQLYSLSDQTKELFKDIENDKKITINFCQPFDSLAETYELNLIYQCAKEYEKAFDFIEVDYIDIISDPSSVEKFANSSNSRITQNSVVVTSEDKDGKMIDFRTFTWNSFFATYEGETEPAAFSGEVKFTSAILQLVGDSPVAYFTVGHGEETGYENARPSLWELFENAGYEVKTIDLSKDSFDKESQVLIINGPDYDFGGEKDAFNEVDKIGDFLGQGGNLMLFVDPTTPNLPELEALIEEWGIRIEDATIFDYENSFDVDGIKLNASYATDTVGSKLHEQLRLLDSTPRVVVERARPLTILQNDWVTDNVTKKNASSVITTYNTAKAKALDNSDFSKNGPYNLMTITCEQSVKNNQIYESYVLVVSSSDFANNSYIYNNTYANTDILYAAMKVMGKETIPHSISEKMFYDNSLTITNKAANNWTLIISVIVPLVVLGVGVVIQVRRRHL